MNRSCLLPMAVLLSGVTLAQDPPSAVAPSPPAQSTRWVFLETTKLDASYLRANWNGDNREYRPFDATVETTSQRSWVDAGPEAGRRAPFVRTFEDVGHGLSIRIGRKGKPEEGRALASSELVGRSVRFLAPVLDAEDGPARLRVELLPPAARPGADDGPDAEARTESPARAEETGEPTWLAGLDPATGSTGLAPAGGWNDLEPGQSWSVPAEAFGPILRPGGDLPSFYRGLEGARDPDYLALYGGLAVCRQAGPITGTSTATFERVDTEDGERLARVALTYDLEIESDPGAWMRAQSKPFEMAMVGQTATDAKTACRLVGTGIVLWDLERDHAVEVTLRAETTMLETFEFSFEIRGTTIAGDYALEVVGETEISLVAAR